MHNHTTAESGFCTPGNDEALAGDAAQGSKDVAQSASYQCTGIDETRKHFDTLRARLALADHALLRTDSSDGGPDGRVTYYVSCWGLVREFFSLGAVEKLARQVGA
jgi:hypothetical protein